MGAAKRLSKSHVVDILGNTVGRDQPIMPLDKAIELVSLISKENFIDDDVVFFDPFVKAGEILLACALTSCRHKAETDKKLVSVDTVSQEIYFSNRYFGLSPDERHHKLSLRTFLGNTNSHKHEYTHVFKNGDYVSEENGNLNKIKFNEELKTMIDYIKKTSGKKRIIAVGNPPYQESDGGFSKSSKNIYQYFTEALISSSSIDEFIVVVPSRWFVGGKGLENFRELMLNTKHLENLKYFSRASDVFPTVDINGGVCFLHYNKSYNGPTHFMDKKYSEKVRFSDFDVIPDDPLAFSLIKKIQKKWNGKYIGDVAWSSKPFGLRTNYFQQNTLLDSKHKDSIPCLSRGKKIKNASIQHITKNKDKINLWKVGAAAVGGGSKGQRRSTIPLNQIFIVPKGVISTETYNIIDVFKNKKTAENLVSYLKTDFSRYFLGLRKITQHIPKDRWNWVPYMDMSKTWTDKELYKFFGITKDEQEHIKAKIQEWS